MQELLIIYFRKKWLISCCQCDCSQLNHLLISSLLYLSPSSAFLSLTVSQKCSTFLWFLSASFPSLFYRDFYFLPEKCSLLTFLRTILSLCRVEVCHYSDIRDFTIHYFRIALSPLFSFVSPSPLYLYLYSISISV